MKEEVESNFMLFRHAILSRPNHVTNFCAVAMSSRKKRKRSSCLFLPWRAVKRKTKNCFDIDKDWADKLAASDKGLHLSDLYGARVGGSCAAQLCRGNFALFISADHIDQKAICIVSYPVYYHFYPAARISGSITRLRDSLPCVRLRLLLFLVVIVPVTFFPFWFL